MKQGTEKRNPRSMTLDQMSVKEILLLMNKEDSGITQAIYEEIANIEALVQAVIDSLKQGGRLFYIGAGTSGRLGVLDAVECVPTFGTPPELVQGLMAGGEKALIHAVEGAEDSQKLAMEDLKERKLSKKDIVIGIAASGRTPYVAGGLNYANEIGARTGAISNNEETKISQLAEYPIELLTGPEILTGSTRLKAGTAAKLVLNMISTTTMVHLGKVYKNLMVDVLATNEKLVDRSKRIVVEATGVDYDKAERVLKEAETIKLAIVMILAEVSKTEAESALDENDGFVRNTLLSLEKDSGM